MISRSAGPPSVALALASILLAGCGVFGGQAPLPPGTQECVGMEQAQCAQVLGSMVGSRNARPVAWRIRCTSVCDRKSGDVEMVVTWSDGTTETSGMSWAGQLGPGIGPPQPAGPVETPAVPPTCVRVPQVECESQWLTILENVEVAQRPHVRAVVIDCTTSCTLAEGDGTTTVVLDDGTEVLVTSWSYDHSQ